MASVDLDALLAPAPPASKSTKLSGFRSWLRAAEEAEGDKVAAAPGSKRPRAAEDKWWEMPVMKLTPAVRRDVSIIQSRSYIDPKRFYKTTKEHKRLPTRFQIGTIVGSAMEGAAGRLTNKQRQSSIAKELLHDEQFKAYGQKHVDAISARHEASKMKPHMKKPAGSARRKKSRR